MNSKYVIGSIIIVVFMIVGITAFVNTTIAYVSISEAMRSKQTVQVMGKIDFDKVNFNSEENRLEFAIYDPEAKDKTTALSMDVVYYGIIPGNFDQAISIVVKGKKEGEHFVCDKLLVKCPSKYQGDEGQEYQDLEKHNEATGQSGV